MSKKADAATPIDRLQPEVKGAEGHFYAVIETTRGSQNKYKYEPDAGYFMLHKVLPVGAVFPYDFGFIPGTQAQDGDPLDVLILMDQSAFTGCVVEIRLVGVIEAEQTEKGETMRNDRLLGVAVQSNNYENLRSLKEMDENLLDELEHFFVSYDQMAGKKFKPIARRGPNHAQALVEEAIQAYRKGQEG